MKDATMKKTTKPILNILQWPGVRSVIAVMVLGLLAGCATPSGPTKATYYFFPPPPDEPRLQFLTSFHTEKEFRGGEDRSFMSYVTGQKPPTREISKPYGLTVSGNKFYICDTDYGGLIVADLQTRQMRLLQWEGQGRLGIPVNVAVDKDGTIYIADSGRDQVMIYDKNENYVTALGKVGEMKPRDVVLSRDRIYVADIQNRCVHVYDKAARTNLFDLPRGSESTNLASRLFMPTNLALDSQGRLYVSDTGAFRVQIYDADGHYVRYVGGMGDSPGQFARVKGVAVDHEGRLYAADAMSQVVQIFDQQGRPLTWFGEPGMTGQVQNLPAKVVVDYDDAGYFQRYVAPGFKVEYLVIVVNQMGTHKVSVYGFGHMK
jgi:DNA-binding beta-propeller fold protein YncE